MFSLRQMSHISSDLIGLAASPLLAVTSPGWYNTIKHNLREQPQHYYKLFRKILENVSQPLLLPSGKIEMETVLI